MMKKPILIFLLSVLALSLPGCAPAAEDARLTVVCTTYPIYLFASSIAEGVDGVSVERLDTGNTSCLHDYTLSMGDMKKLERADVIALNGAGLEEFLEPALAASGAAIIDCSQGVELLESLSHNHDGDEDHDHGRWDPHYWMDPGRAAVMACNLEAGLWLADPDHRLEYQAGPVLELLDRCRARLDVFDSLEIPGLITFHDGFQYFAEGCGLPLLASIEEEAGSEASAREVVEITQLVKAYNLPVIFTEVDGSDATANAIARETGCKVARLTMLMDGPESGLEAYDTGIAENISAILRGFTGGEKEVRP